MLLSKYYIYYDYFSFRTKCAKRQLIINVHWKTFQLTKQIVSIDRNEIISVSIIYSFTSSSKTQGMILQQKLSKINIRKASECFIHVEILLDKI